MDLFYSKFNANTKLITINETDSKHITKSFRKNIGDIIRITNGKGLLCEAEILEKGKNIKVKVYGVHDKNQGKLRKFILNH